VSDIKAVAGENGYSIDVEIAGTVESLIQGYEAMARDATHAAAYLKHHGVEASWSQTSTGGSWANRAERIEHQATELSLMLRLREVNR
jgi:hypothetical protein